MNLVIRSSSVKQVIGLMSKGEKINYSLLSDGTVTYLLQGFGVVNIYHVLFLKRQGIIQLSSGSAPGGGQLELVKEKLVGVTFVGS